MQKNIMILLILAGLCFIATAKAELAITEIMSDSDHSGSTDGDWWELTNTGPLSVNLTGYSWDDNSHIAGTVTFGSITIGVGESIIILDEPSSDTNAWKSQWGLGSEVNVYDRSHFTGSFSGLGSSDDVALFDAGGVLVTSVTYPSRTSRISNEWDTSGIFLGLSVIGENGAYQSTNLNPDVGSPGYAVHIENTCTTLAGMVYWTDKNASKIQRANVNCGGVEDLLTATDGLSDPRGISLDLTSRKMYWADNGTKKIHRADLDSSNVEDVVVGLSYPADIALDLSDGKVYWADRDAGKIQRKNLDGTGPIEDVITGITQPYYLALDKVNGKIYWSDFDSSIIHRANFDGSGVENFITGLDRVRDIALDVAGSRIYWGDRDSSKVQRANLDGTGIEDLFDSADGLDRPHGLTLDTATGRMFWTDTATHTVYIANMDGSGSAESLATGLNGPWGIAIISTRQIIYVDADVPGPVHDGLNWHDAYLYLQDALDAAASGDEIRIAQGIYKPDQDEGGNVTPGDREATFQLINGVALKGGYAGYGEPNPDKRDIETYETILSGDLNGNDAEAGDPRDLLDEPTRSENSYHVVTATNADETTVLEGFTITAGNANSDVGGERRYAGGGMFNNGHNTSCNPTVTDCTFIGNSSIISGGAMYNNGHGDGESNPIVTNCKFLGNASENGGGMGNFSGHPVVTNCTFIGNSALIGGGMNSYSGHPVVTNCTFSSNIATYGGGGMSIASEPPENYEPTLTNCIFWGNSDDGGTDESAQINNITTLEINHNCVQGWTGALGGSGNHGDDPLFVDADGGDNIPGTEDDDLRLSSTGSPCFDAGDNAALPPGVSDLDGNPRIINGTVDMGAYELGPNAKTCIADFDGDLFVNLRDFYMLAQEWLKTGDSLETDLIDDDKIDEFDLAAFVERWLTPCYLCSEADIYTDGKIDLKDYSVLANDWLKEGPDLDGDITGNWIVDTLDLEVLVFHWLNTCQ